MKQFKFSKKRLERERRQRELVAQIRAAQGNGSGLKADNHAARARRVTRAATGNGRRDNLG